ncbi:Serine/threonine-protein kinase PrkC [Rosistilla ulvae]|uniref:Serine/threonine-protein kinase PrkC n=1 Tax=Rosistilla ulvae TaxID=1930277 RepID=A0A517M3G8_9BACT|nr:serine/threonine-protein kinase [Rosistilla ulvae]QDS89410.1 Serine/threonine-protein kinase PrkC [Rosistilla ulvae]
MIYSPGSGATDVVSGSDPRRGAAPEEPLPSGSDRYAGDHELGRGGWGVVMRANDLQLDRDVAVKQLGAHAVGNADLVQRFIHEGLLTAQLQHPGIVPVYERGVRREDGQPFYAMKLLDGVTLEHKIRDCHCQQPGPKKQALLHELLRSFVDICNAVAYAHQQKIIHRDLKPANVIVGQFGETVVVDWGLAKRLDDSSVDDSSADLNAMATLAGGTPIAGSPDPAAGTNGPVATRIGTVVGTPAYMSPEQARGATDRIGPSSDIYSLGIILYELLTGRTPFQADDVQVTLANVIAGRYEKPREIDRSVPRPLESICIKAIAAQPQDRYETAQQIAEEVSCFLAGDKVDSHRETAIERFGRASRQRPALVAAIIVGATVLAVCASATSVVVARAHRSERLAKEQALRAHAEEVVVRKQAEDERHWAYRHLHQVQDAADGWLNQLNRALANYPAVEPLRRDLLRRAIVHYQSLYHGLVDRAQHPLDAVRCLLEVANLQRMSGDFLSAEQTYLIARESIAAIPDYGMPTQRLLRARVLVSMGLLQSARQTGVATHEMISDLQTAVAGLANPFGSEPLDSGSLVAMAEGNLVIGRFLMRGSRCDESIAALREALRYAMLLESRRPSEGLRRLSEIQIALSEAYRNADRNLQAAATLGELIDRIDALPALSRSRTDWLSTRAWAQVRWGQVEQTLGESAAAGKAYRRGLEDLASAWQLLEQTSSSSGGVVASDEPDLRWLLDRCLECAANEAEGEAWGSRRPWGALLQELQSNVGLLSLD